MEDRIQGNLEETEYEELGDDQKVSIGKWFLLNAPPGQVLQVAKDVRELLTDSQLYDRAASEAFPEYNVRSMISLEMPDGSGKVLLTKFGELDRSHFLVPRTASVAVVDHVKQMCTEVRPADDEELPSAYVEGFRFCVDVALLKYVDEAFQGGECSVYCTKGKDLEKSGGEFEVTVVISNSSYSPKNFRGGCWQSVWGVLINEELHSASLQGTISVNAHYFEEGNVQLQSSRAFNDTVLLQDGKDAGTVIVNSIEHLESVFLSNLEEQFANLSDRTFKELRRKLPVTRTLFAWDKALQLSLTREITREFSGNRR
ncbi:F-actin-capping protein subunit alpha isoform X1 [Physcomitrium patens]|uniref:F-actin-capping protein subunit alpha n=2 Tax=Physcomitrium patens TaxID=3218 RepID=A9RW21_PHYPA|nr:F-actin-capping protein subunit alpha-like [Physcomitrium patens]|eukprot:XP_024385990.1 F-actin-capping protein subunit alpha-like [Physcomitrella patens]